MGISTVFMAQMNGGAEQVLQFLRPTQARALLNQPLQVANLMLQAQLVRDGRSVQLSRPTVTLPDLSATLAHERVNHVLAATRHDQMILQSATDEDPFPVVAALHTRAMTRMVPSRLWSDDIRE